MLPTLSEVLALPALRAATVETLTGDPEATPIRWVHSSEVYEMGGLLAGGELLLTTGLGLHGRTPEQLVAYIDQLADAGCAALGLELGRSFFVAPAGLVSAARRRGLVVLALHSVVPFERIVEDFHELLLQRRAGVSVPALAELVAVVQHGQGLRSLLDAVARLTGCAVEVVDLEEQVVESSRIAVPREEVAPVRVRVRGATGVVGEVRVFGVGTPRLMAVAEDAATAVALEWGRSGAQSGAVPSVAGALVGDLLSGTPLSQREVADRLNRAGWVGRPGGHVVVAMVELGGGVDPGPELGSAVVRIFGSGVIGRVRDQVFVLVPASGADRGRVRRLFGEVYEALGGDAGDAVRRIAVAPATQDLAALGARVAEARDMLRLARTSGLHRGVVLPPDVAVERLLVEAGAGEAAHLVEQHLGPLIAHDTTSAADLVRTLDAFVHAQGAKATAAQSLGIRRQTLYARLRRIEQILGIDLTHPSHLLTVAVALRAWRLRSGVDPQTAFERTRGWSPAE